MKFEIAALLSVLATATSIKRRDETRDEHVPVHSDHHAPDHSELAQDAQDDFAEYCWYVFDNDILAWINDCSKPYGEYCQELLDDGIDYEPFVDACVRPIVDRCHDLYDTDFYAW